MNKNYLITICISVLLCFLFIKNSKSQIDTIRLSSLSLKGNVSRISEFNFSAKDSLGNIVKGTYLNEDFNFVYEEKESEFFTKTNKAYEFDRNGNLLIKISYHNPNFPLETTKYLYQNGLIIEKNVLMKYSDISIRIKDIYKYDNYKNLISKTKYRNDELLDKETYKYDLNSNLIEKNEIDNEGTVKLKVIYKYENRKKIYEKQSKEKSFNEEHYVYDNLGNLIFSSTLYSKDEYYENDMFFETFYDYKDSLLSVISEYRDKKETWKTNLNYTNGKLVKETKIFQQDNSSLTVKDYKYFPDNSFEVSIKENAKQTLKHFDENNNLIKLQFIYNDGKIEEYNYEFQLDKKGNWIKIIESKNSIPLKIRERKITYFTS